MTSTIAVRRMAPVKLNKCGAPGSFESDLQSHEHSHIHIARRPLPLNNGLKGTGFTACSRSPGLHLISSLIEERLGRYPKKLLGREV